MMPTSVELSWPSGYPRRGTGAGRGSLGRPIPSEDLDLVAETVSSVTPSGYSRGRRVIKEASGRQQNRIGM